MENLHHRKIVPSPLCPLCKQEAETLEHTLLPCPWTAKVWNSAPLHLQISRIGLTRFEDWICNIQQNPVISGKFNHIAVVLWSIWNERNQFIFSHQNLRPQSTIARAEAFTESYRAINGKSNSKKETKHLSETWLPPLLGTLRINIDASFALDLAKDAASTDARDPPRHRAAIACVCRDHRGFLVDGFVKPVDAASASQAEAIAMDETLNFIESRSFLSPQVHSDCLSLVHTLKSSTELSWELQPIVSQAQAKLAHLPGLSLAHCNRSSNCPADWIAKACRNNSLPPNWISNPPCFI
ncbi:hypothetical protein ACJRO7_004564 [Eucalyptus globulus]|uniref:RNase H type-1 domain-containing protein n=1 Tax=Eucalyptus globulus TaxID=34317 RepID=A0ABD3IZ64_EUCGL